MKVPYPSLEEVSISLASFHHRVLSSIIIRMIEPEEILLATVSFHYSIPQKVFLYNLATTWQKYPWTPAGTKTNLIKFILQMLSSKVLRYSCSLEIRLLHILKKNEVVCLGCGSDINKRSLPFRMLCAWDRWEPMWGRWKHKCLREARYKSVAMGKEAAFSWIWGQSRWNRSHQTESHFFHQMMHTGN